MTKCQHQYLVPALIVIAGVALALFMYSGPYVGYDDAAYIAYAHQILAGTFNITQSPYDYGLLFTSTLALSVYIFGANIYAISLPGVVEYVAIMLFTFLIARRLYNKRIANMSLLAVATAPFVVAYVTRALPDMLQGALAAAAIYIFVMATQSKGHKHILYFASGVVAMLCVYAQLLSLLFVFFFACAVFALAIFFKTNGKKARPLELTVHDSAYVVAGMVLMLVIYLMIFYWLTGNPLYIYHYSSFESTNTPGILYNTLEFIITIYSYGSPASAGLAPSSLAGEIPPIGPMALWAIAGVFIGYKKRDRAAILCSIIGIGFLLYLFFGTISLSSYTTAYVVTRYFMVVAAPLAILSAYAISDIADVFAIVFREKGRLAVIGAFLAITLGFNALVLSSLYVYNQSIYHTTMIFSDAAKAAIASNPNATTQFWVADPIILNFSAGGYGIDPVASFLWFVTGFNSSVIVRNTAGTSCNPSISNQYLAALYAANTQNTTLIMDAWLGTNCTISYIGNYTSMTTPIRIELYKVG